MIFLCVGSREYQFDRLIKEVDRLLEENIITDRVIGQIGSSKYIPKNFKYERFMSSDKFKAYQKEADIIISHGGTGSLIGALKLEKQVIAVPRLGKFNEHMDDHQIGVSKLLHNEGYLKYVIDINNLGETILSIKENPINKRYRLDSNVLNIIEDFIN